MSTKWHIHETCHFCQKNQNWTYVVLRAPAARNRAHNKRQAVAGHSFTKYFLSKIVILLQQDAIERKQWHQPEFPSRENKIQEQSPKVLGALRFTSRSVCKRGELLSPKRGGRFLDTISGSSPSPWSRPITSAHRNSSWSASYDSAHTPCRMVPRRAIQSWGYT